MSAASSDEPRDDSRTDLSVTSETSLSFGKYRLTRLLARGGMGEVYLARLVGELGFEKRLVIKTILPHLAAKPRFVEMFAAEAKTAVALSHGNIVPIYELGRTGDILYIVMGHVDGPSVSTMLDAYRAQERAPELGCALHLVRGVLTGLAYAHTAEPGRPAVVHRDITPRNVLVDRSGQVRICDFGIAAPVDAEVEMRGGSTGYASPEQIRGDSVDPRADVFSTACLLYELVTLERAFPKEGVWAPPDLEGVPDELRGPLKDALALDPVSRPSDAHALLERLQPAFARHAAVFGDGQLAQHLRTLFPEGWESHSQPAVAGKAGKPRDRNRPETHTFATRLTLITQALPVERGLAGATTPRRSRAWLAGAGVLALGAVAWWWLAARPPAGELPAASASEPSIAAAPPSPDPSPPREHSPVPAKPPADPPAVVPPAPPELTRVALVVDPADATVSVDGTIVADLGAIELADGATVTVRKPGYVSFTTAVDAAHPLPAKVVLRPAKKAGQGWLQVFASEVAWAEVTIDGRKVGTTPTRKLAVAEGSHQVVVTCTEACPSKQVLLRRRITIEAGATQSLRAE